MSNAEAYHLATARRQHIYLAEHRQTRRCKQFVFSIFISPSIHVMQCVCPQRLKSYWNPGPQFFQACLQRLIDGIQAAIGHMKIHRLSDSMQQFPFFFPNTPSGARSTSGAISFFPPKRQWFSCQLCIDMLLRSSGRTCIQKFSSWWFLLTANGHLQTLLEYSWNYSRFISLPLYIVKWLQ